MRDPEKTGQSGYEPSEEDYIRLKFRQMNNAASE